MRRVAKKLRKASDRKRYEKERRKNYDANQVADECTGHNLCHSSGAIILYGSNTELWPSATAAKLIGAIASSHSNDCLVATVGST